MSEAIKVLRKNINLLLVRNCKTRFEREAQNTSDSRLERSLGGFSPCGSPTRKSFRYLRECARTQRSIDSWLWTCLVFPTPAPLFCLLSFDFELCF